MGAIVLGLIVGVVCLFFCSTVKNAFGYDDSLDVFGVHCIGGIVGAIGTGILVNPALGGTGIMDYTTGKIADYELVRRSLRSSRRWRRRWCGRGRLADPLQDRRHRGRPARHADRSAKVSTSPTTVSAPTICKHRVRAAGRNYPAPPLADGNPGLRTGVSFLCAICGPFCPVLARCRWLIGP
jgi:hypothetical protein